MVSMPKSPSHRHALPVSVSWKCHQESILGSDAESDVVLDQPKVLPLQPSLHGAAKVVFSNRSPGAASPRLNVSDVLFAWSSVPNLMMLQPLAPACLLLHLFLLCVQAAW
jgi:hypothetical protein